jgi:hypothetical protein
LPTVSTTPEVHGRLIELARGTDDAVLRERAEHLLSFYDGIVAAHVEGRADIGAVHDDVQRFHQMAHRLMRQAHTGARP